jgi:RNA polymerase sigma-70 factor, ECF subfamily
VASGVRRVKNEPNDSSGALVGMESDLTSTSAGRAALVESARAGSRDAFGQLVSPHLAAALGTARLVAGSAEDGADAVQEALLSAWQGLDSLRDPDAFPAWFRRQVVRAALRSAKRQHRLTELNLEHPAPGGALEQALAVRQLDRAFDQLDPGDRVVLALRHAWDLPGIEIARLLEIPEGTVKSRVHAALTRLRAAYDAEDRR